MIMLMAAFGAFAAEDEEKEDEKEGIASGFFNFEEESVVNVEDGAFDGFETKVKTLEGGVNLNLVDDIGLVLTPYAGVSDVKAEVDAIIDPLGDIHPSFKFDEATVYAGLKLALAPIDMLGLEFALYQTDYFGDKAANLGVAAGFGFSVGLSLNVEQAFLELEVADALEPTWSGNRTGKAYYTHLYNDFTYGLRFNFFNFIKDTLNTGLYIDGEFEVDADWGDDADDPKPHTGTEFTNEFNAGIVTNPIDWFEGYVGFKMMNENLYGPEVDLGNRKGIFADCNNKFGLKVGTTFIYKCVSFDLNWVGYFGNFAIANIDICDPNANWDWGDNGPFKQEITFTVGVALE